MTKFKGSVVESANGFKGKMIQSVKTYTASGAIDIDDNIVQIDATDGDVALTLADGEIGQRMLIKCLVASTNTVTVTPDNFHDGTDITFGSNDTVAELYFDGTEWELFYTDATVA